jgi:hypothetical protein
MVARMIDQAPYPVPTPVLIKIVFDILFCFDYSRVTKMNFIGTDVRAEVNVVGGQWFNGSRYCAGTIWDGAKVGDGLGLVSQ